MTGESGRAPYPVLGLAVLLVSTGAILVRFAEAPALAVSFQRVFLASLILAPFVQRQARSSWPALLPHQRWAMLASGFCLALHFATWIASLSYTSVAVSVLLVNTAPVFAILLSRWFLKEAVSRVVLAAIGLALVGALLIAAADWTGSAGSLLGAGLALAGAITVAVYAVIGRGLRSTLPLGAYNLGVWSTAAVVLALLALAFSIPLFRHPPGSYLAFLGLALVPTIGGHGLVNRSLRLLPAPTVGLFLLGEPLVASIMAYFLFGEVPGALTLLGGAIVLAALAIVVLTKRA